MVICYSSPKTPTMGEKRKTHALLSSFFMGTTTQIFSSGESSHSLPRKLQVHWYCVFHMDLNLRDFMRKGICRPEWFSPARYLAHLILLRLILREDTDEWQHIQFCFLTIQKEIQLSCLYSSKDTDRPQKKMFEGPAWGVSKRNLKHRISPSGLQGRDKCHSISPPSSSLLGLVFLFVYFIPCIF